MDVQQLRSSFIPSWDKDDMLNQVDSAFNDIAMQVEVAQLSEDARIRIFLELIIAKSTVIAAYVKETHNGSDS